MDPFELKHSHLNDSEIKLIQSEDLIRQLSYDCDNIEEETSQDPEKASKEEFPLLLIVDDDFMNIEIMRTMIES